METQTQQYITDSNGKKTAVILPLEQYEKLKADLHDLAVVAERRNEGTISAEEMDRQLKEDGLL